MKIGVCPICETTFFDSLGAHLAQYEKGDSCIFALKSEIKKAEKARQRANKLIRREVQIVKWE